MDQLGPVSLDVALLSAGRLKSKAVARYRFNTTEKDHADADSLRQRDPLLVLRTLFNSGPIQTLLTTAGFFAFSLQKRAVSRRQGFVKGLPALFSREHFTFQYSDFSGYSQEAWLYTCLS